MYMTLCLHLSIYVHECECQQRPEESIEFSGAGTTGGCEPSGVGNRF